jgi:hypothetical protein
MLIPNTIFRMGSAAIMLTNKRSGEQRSAVSRSVRPSSRASCANTASISPKQNTAAAVGAALHCAALPLSPSISLSEVRRPCALLLCLLPAERRRSKYELQHIVRVHLGADDKAYRCVPLSLPLPLPHWCSAGSRAQLLAAPSPAPADLQCTAYRRADDGVRTSTDPCTQ